MTHPDTLQIPRAVVEQTILGIDFVNSLGASKMPTVGLQSCGLALHAALQAQAASPNFCESCVMDLSTCDCVNPRPVHVTYAPTGGRTALEVAQTLRHTLSNVLQHAPKEIWPKYLAVRDECDAALAALQQAAAEPHTFNDESPFCVKCGSTGEDTEGPVAHILPRDLKILKFKSMPVPVDPLPYDNGEEKTVPLYTTPPATQAAPVSLQAAHDAVTIDTLNDRVMRQQAALTAALDYLWVVVEHNRLHFGDSHNTVIQGQAVVAQIEALKGPTP